MLSCVKLLFFIRLIVGANVLDDMGKMDEIKNWGGRGGEDRNVSVVIRNTMKYDDMRFKFCELGPGCVMRGNMRGVLRYEDEQVFGVEGNPVYGYCRYGIGVKEVVVDLSFYSDELYEWGSGRFNSINYYVWGLNVNGTKRFYNILAF